MLLIDDRYAMVPAKAGFALITDQLLVVHPSGLLDVLAEVFEETWLRAMPLRLGPQRPGRARNRRRPRHPGNLLATRPDRAVDRPAVGASQRTVQRRIREISERLGARTRFQAGLQAAPATACCESCRKSPGRATNCAHGLSDGICIGSAWREIPTRWRSIITDAPYPRASRSRSARRTRTEETSVAHSAPLCGQLSWRGLRLRVEPARLVRDRHVRRASILLLALDLLIVTRRPHAPSMREASLWVAFYVGLAVVFGVVLGFVGHAASASGEFFAGWLTEYSLWVDNLFIFVIIMASSTCRGSTSRQSLMVGIILALIIRGIFIAARRRRSSTSSPGASTSSARSWCTPRSSWPATVRPRRRRRERRGEVRAHAQVLPLTHKCATACKLRINENGKRLMTPMLIVIVSLGTTDLLFALDSIPAIYGLHPGALPRLHREHLRADGSAPALLPDRRPAQAARLPVATASRSSWRSSASSWSCTPCTRTSCRSSTAASTKRGGAHLAVPDGHRRHPDHHHDPRPQ